MRSYIPFGLHDVTEGFQIERRGRLNTLTECFPGALHFGPIAIQITIRQRIDAWFEALMQFEPVVEIIKAFFIHEEKVETPIIIFGASKRLHISLRRLLADQKLGDQIATRGLGEWIWGGFRVIR